MTKLINENKLRELINDYKVYARNARGEIACINREINLYESTIMLIENIIATGEDLVE